MADVDGPPRSHALWIPASATVLVVAAFAVAHLTMLGQWRMLDAICEAPRATLASPRRDGPAIYRGVIEGPPDRKAPLGAETAAHWWWVIYDSDGDDTRTVCYHAEVAGLALVDGPTRRALAMFENERANGMLWDGRNWDLEAPTVVDLGPRSWPERDDLPAEAMSCRGEDRTYVERYVPRGATVDVLACFDGTRLVPCPGPRGGVLAVAGMAAHRERVRWNTEVNYLVAAGGALLVLILAAIAALVSASRMTRRLW